MVNRDICRISVRKPIKFHYYLQASACRDVATLALSTAGFPRRHYKRSTNVWGGGYGVEGLMCGVQQGKRWTAAADTKAKRHAASRSP